MCGFLARRERGNNFYIQHRGQDCTSQLEAGGFTFIHNLLSVTGEPTPQPYTDGGVVCLFNGEIYNHDYERSDGEVILPLYRQHGDRFARHLDGEFAIAIYDFEAGRVLWATDAFGCKPLYYNDALECASYASGIEHPWPVPPNTTLVSEHGVLAEAVSSHEFVWGQHDKTDYDDWLAAFDTAVRKRARDRCFYGLSSGYDSGAINLALRRHDVDAKAYAMLRGENTEIVEERLAETPDHAAFVLPRPDIERIREYMVRHTEPFEYRIHRDDGWHTSSLFDDGAAISMSAICATGQREGRKVYLSGQGADEILADYALVPEQSEFKGRFPDTIEAPWRNFHDSCMSSYLGKEERIAGTYNIETRYPFLDVAVVQEFLFLHPSLKNATYKAPLAALFERDGYPYERDVKRGFGV